VSRTALLDVNVLVALFDPDHVHHEIAHDWFADEGRAGWATCPVTENGFLRVVGNPAYGAGMLWPGDLIERLHAFCRSGRHVFWPDAVSFRNTRLFNTAVIRSPRQLTDIYLLGLARYMKGRLATFDRSIPLGAVVGATRDTLAVVSPTESGSAGR
jgi:toxin-antitoxin system PIN domain toxin